MIIVSQDEKAIINFDNVTEIRVSNNQIFMFDNTYRDSCDCSDVLGIYGTEERAKEVLQEIIKAYTDWEIFKYGLSEGFCNPKYEMPEE